ncbi:MAG: uracil phosphoribosyltransferase [Bdellovibrionota bacterium]
MPSFETQYVDSTSNDAFRKHAYGQNVYLINNVAMLSKLAWVCQTHSTQPHINHVIKDLYRGLLNVVVQTLFTRKTIEVPTRMADAHPKEAIFKGDVLDPSQKVVICGMARAGTLPSMEVFEELSFLLHPKNVRADHIAMNRVTNENHKVQDALIHGHKIGGNIDQSWVLLPDPMGATGSSINNVISLYKNSIEGTPRAFVCMNLIITPEFIHNVKTKHPQAVIFALRLDRGFSSEKALQSIPGTYPEEEKGLNNIDYIVPGGGGLGELMNNSWT